jgi:hypothetical protein
MTSWLYERKVRIFNYPRFADPFRDQLREHAGRLAGEVGRESQSTQEPQGSPGFVWRLGVLTSRRFALLQANVLNFLRHDERGTVATVAIT